MIERKRCKNCGKRLIAHVTIDEQGHEIFSVCPGQLDDIKTYEPDDDGD